MSEEKPVKCWCCGKEPEKALSCDYTPFYKCKCLAKKKSDWLPINEWNEEQIMLNAFLEAKEREAFYAGHDSCQQNGEHRLESQFDEWKAGREK